jgi:hypothetical protein
MQTDHADKVFTLICRGLERSDIIAYAAEFRWCETEAEIDELIDHANTELVKRAASVDPEIEFGKAVVRLDNLFMDAKKVQDLKTALQIQKELNKLLTLKLKPRTATAPVSGERPRLKIAR